VVVKLLEKYRRTVGARGDFESGREPTWCGLALDDGHCIALLGQPITQRKSQSPGT
jgi:hypothetical protein